MRSCHDLGIDLGNSKFSICGRSEGLIISEASFLAYHGPQLSEASLVAMGDEAWKLSERAPPGVHVISPMQEGIVVDCGAASLLLKCLLKKAGLRWRLSKPELLVAALYGASSVERKAFIDVAASLNCKRALAVYEPMAAANALDLDLSSPFVNMVVDIGDGATEAIVLASGQLVLGQSLRFGGYDIDSLLMAQMRRRHGLVISRAQARNLKLKLASLRGKQAQAAFLAVKGSAVDNRLPCEKKVAISEFHELLDSIAEKLAEFVLSLLTRLSPEAAVDLIENGIYLCGGASQTSLVQERIREKTKLTVNLMELPHQAVIQGLGRMLHYTKILLKN